MNEEENNPIIAEIRRTREAILAEHNGDLASLVRELERKTEERARAGWPMYSPPTHQKPAEVPPVKNAG